MIMFCLCAKCLCFVFSYWYHKYYALGPMSFLFSQSSDDKRNLISYAASHLDGVFVVFFEVLNFHGNSVESFQNIIGVQVG